MNETPSFNAAVGTAPAEKPQVVKICDGIIRWTLRVLVALIPVFFLPWTIEVLELNKQLLLLIGAGIAGMAWLGKMLAERKFEYRRSVVNLIVVLYLAVYLISSLLSLSRYTSLVGDFGQEKSGLITVAAFILLYFVVVNNIRTVRDLNRLFFAVMLGGAVAAIFALFQGFGLFMLPFAFTKAASFNTVGTIASLALYLAFVVTLAGGLLLSGHHQSGQKSKLDLAYNIFLAAVSVISLFLIAAIDYWPVTVCLLVASALIIAFAFVHARSIKRISGVLLPIAAFVVALLLLFFRFPNVGLQFPAEIMPSMKASTQIAVKVLRDRPFFGSGPGTFLYDYSKFRAAEVNQSSFWNVRFDRGASRFLTLISTNGLLGTLSWLLVALFLLVSAIRKLLKADEETWHLMIGMFAAWFLLIVAKFVYSSSLTLEFATWLTMAFLVIVHRRDFFSVKFENSPRAAMMLSFVFILSTVVAVSGLVVEIQRYVAEIHYANAIRTDQAGGDVDQVVNELVKAADLNQANDVYVRNLGLAALAKANVEAAKPIDLKKDEGETDDAFKAREDAAKQDKIRLVATLASNAVNIAKQATDLNGANVANWSVLATIYQNLFGVTQGADEWAVKSYDKAIELEPSNPALYVERGKVFMYQASVAGQGKQSQDEAVKAEATKNEGDLLAKAVDDFNKAIELKSDYAPARYQLAVALDGQGKLKDAIKKMEEVIAMSPKDVGVGLQLALMYYRDDRKDEARQLLEAVVKLSPSYSNARWYLAAMYEEKGDLDKAIEQIKKVDELNPNTDLIKKKLADLEAKKAAPAAAPGQLPQPVEQPVTNPATPEVQKR